MSAQVAMLLGSAAISGISGRSAAKKAKAAGRANARLIVAETAENVRRMRINADRALGVAHSRVGASNIMMSGSQQKYTQALETQLMSDISWTKRRGALAARVARKGGSLAASSIKTNTAASMLGYGAQALGVM